MIRRLIGLKTKKADVLSKEIPKLINEYIRILYSNRNNSNKSFYNDTDSIILDKFRGIPRQIKDEKIPFIFWLGLDIWKDLFNINIEKMYKDPKYYLECWLKIKIFYFNNFNDCNYYGNLIPLWLGEGFESTFLGCRLKYSKIAEPSVNRDYILVKDHNDLKKMKLPDFENSASMNHAINFFNSVNFLLGDSELRANFPDWHYGPTAMCNYLRGFKNLSLDFLTNKPLVDELMQFVIDSRMKWSETRSRIIDDDKPNGAIISNDDVSVPNVSPNIFRELIFPYEKILNEFYGYFSYYHNCGPIDPFLDDISNINGIRMIHSGPFSDFKKIGEIFSSKAAIELHLHPDRDFINCSEEDFRKRLIDIKTYYDEIGVKAYCIRLTSYSHPSMSISENIEKLKGWCRIASNILL